MFSEIPKLFGREFVIAHFIPSALLLVSVAALLSTFDVTFFINEVFSEKLLGITASILVTWIFSVVLMAINSPLIRFIEGYGTYNPLRVRKTRLQRLFRETALPALEEAKRIELARKQHRSEPEPSVDFIKRLGSAVSDFPPEEQWLLPSMIGNSVRAFEVYSRVVYGIDAISAWPRLIMILPEQARAQINDRRAIFDFAANLLLTSVVTILLYVVLLIWFHEIRGLWIPIVYTGAFVFFRYMLGTAARQWGDQVKSVFDLYRADLAEQLGLEMPRSADQESEMWGYVNRMMIFRSKSAAMNLDNFRKKNDGSGQQSKKPVSA